jgi:uncharacterized protein
MYTKSLKTLAKLANPLSLDIEIHERLPGFIPEPCKLRCEIAVQPAREHFILRLKTTGPVVVSCQRCLESFVHYYDHKTELAICSSEEIATQMMSTIDCTVQADDELDLLAIVTDNLHLFIPEKHEDCEIRQGSFK